MLSYAGCPSGGWASAGLDEKAVSLSSEMRSFAEEGARGSPAREQQAWNGCDPAPNYRSGARV
jgi:hypothetical protein